MVVLAPMFELTRIEPARSPGDGGALAETVTVLLAPGASVKPLGVILANGTYCSVSTCHGTVPFVPLSAAVMPKITPVQVPAAGDVTSTFPKFPTPCGSECAAKLPFGSIRINRTRELLPLAGFPG